MKHYLLILCCVLIISVNSFSQEGIKKYAFLDNYIAELPCIEKRAGKELNRIIQNHYPDEYVKNQKFEFCIVPMFKISDAITSYHEGDSFLDYINFDILYYDFDVFVYIDSSFFGELHMSNIDNSLFAILDSNTISKFTLNNRIAISQILKEFEPDLAFYPSSRNIICILKNHEIYIFPISKTPLSIESIVRMDLYDNHYQYLVSVISSDLYIHKKKGFIKLNKTKCFKSRLFGR